MLAKPCCKPRTIELAKHLHGGKTSVTQCAIKSLYGYQVLFYNWVRTWMRENWLFLMQYCLFHSVTVLVSTCQASSAHFFFLWGESIFQIARREGKVTAAVWETCQEPFSGWFGNGKEKKKLWENSHHFAKVMTPSRLSRFSPQIFIFFKDIAKFYIFVPGPQKNLSKMHVKVSGKGNRRSFREKITMSFLLSAFMGKGKTKKWPSQFRKKMNLKFFSKKV